MLAATFVYAEAEAVAADCDRQFSGIQMIDAMADGVSSIVASDLDGDGNTDIVAAMRLDNMIAWYRNVNGLKPFGPPIPIGDANGAESVITADLDGDGDADVVFAAAGENAIGWYENTDGLATFGPRQIISLTLDNPVFVFAAGPGW